MSSKQQYVIAAITKSGRKLFVSKDNEINTAYPRYCDAVFPEDAMHFSSEKQARECLLYVDRNTTYTFFIERA